MKLLKTIVLLLILALPVQTQQRLYLKAYTDSTEYTIGDRVDLHIEVRTEISIDSIAPMLSDSLGSFEVLHVQRNDSEFFWTVYLSTTDSGRVVVPPIPFRYFVNTDSTPHVAYTNPFYLTFRPVLVNPHGDIKDIKPPLSAPLEFEDVLPYLIVLVVIALSISVWYYFKKKSYSQHSHEEMRINIPPHKEALAALRQLEEKKLWQQGFVKEYYSEVTTILRIFFEKRWSILALESTTDEILHQMKRIPEALLVWGDLEWCLRTADLVKFAKYIPSPEENERILQHAYAIVRIMAPKEQQPTEPHPVIEEVSHGR
ncbi:MAG: hypothetical protein N3A63_02465 [Bacteroidetes bacterium]|nr:hypothetical protein [Bacteroidota bacterium]